MLYLGELNSTQEAAWQKTVELVDPEQPEAQQVALFPEDRAPDPIDVGDIPRSEERRVGKECRL